MTDARVLLWGRDIAAVTWLGDQNIGVFQYAPEFVRSGIELSPLAMPLKEGTYQFPSLARNSFSGLPGLLADSLPDRFGNALIDAWLARQGKTVESFNPVERLCYIGKRGMGGLEFLPTIVGSPTSDRKVEVAALVELANRLVDERASLSGQLLGDDDTEALQDILRVGTSAGGARAKAILAWNETTGEFRSGQLPADSGFTQWILKFDGVQNNKDKEVADPQGYGLIEFAYSGMAREAGILMSECRLHRENGRSHFMTKRFDRTELNDKLHMQSLGALMHYDFNQPGAHSYEQAIQAILRLGLSMQDRQQQFRRAVFNVIARNQDDHVKNIAFLMNPEGEWRLSPAFDVVYSFNPEGDWTGKHQMSINGKRDGFELDDLIALAASAGIKKRTALDIIGEVDRAIRNWAHHAETAGLPVREMERIAKAFRNLV